MVHRNLVPSRAAARRAIDDGLVEVGGITATKAATMVGPDDPVTLTQPAAKYVSRGGDKLEAALAAFPIEIAGRSAVDIGASTGGFTDCLLQRGAARVVCVDVGYGQLAWSLQSDARVQVFDRTNIRTADPADLGAPFDVVVADLSFISLGLVAPQLAALGHPASDWVLLVKPQFEAGREAVGSRGLVSDPVEITHAVCSAVAALGAAGVGLRGLVASPLRGAKSGNQEFLGWFRYGPDQIERRAIGELVAAHA